MNKIGHVLTVSTSLPDADYLKLGIHLQSPFLLFCLPEETNCPPEGVHICASLTSSH